eukprot:UN29649
MIVREQEINVETLSKTILDKTEQLLTQFNIEQIYLVFDGREKDLSKEHIWKKRRETRGKIQEKYHNLKNLSLIEDTSENLDTFNKLKSYSELIDFSKNFKHIFKKIEAQNKENKNIIISQAPGDAECECAKLSWNKKVDLVLSKDTDVLPFGVKRWIPLHSYFITILMNIPNLMNN